MENTVKKRAPNFSSKEKNVLLNIVYAFKSIVECKKTDAVTWRQKDEAWNKITANFNSQLPDGCSRSKDSLRKLYDNLKKNARKTVAEEKKEIFKTGGGTPDTGPIDHTTELVLDIVNPKTVYGLENQYDSDRIVIPVDTMAVRTETITSEKTCEVPLDIPTCSKDHSYTINEITAEEDNGSLEIPNSVIFDLIISHFLYSE